MGFKYLVLAAGVVGMGIGIYNYFDKIKQLLTKFYHYCVPEAAIEEVKAKNLNDHFKKQFGSKPKDERTPITLFVNGKTQASQIISKIDNSPKGSRICFSNQNHMPIQISFHLKSENDIEVWINRLNQKFLGNVLEIRLPNGELILKEGKRVIVYGAVIQHSENNKFIMRYPKYIASQKRDIIKDIFLQRSKEWIKNNRLKVKEWIINNKFFLMELFLLILPCVFWFKQKQFHENQKLNITPEDKMTK